MTDTQRLDWLQKNLARTGFALEDQFYTVVPGWTEGDSPFRRCGSTLREAIDAGIEADEAYTAAQHAEAEESAESRKRREVICSDTNSSWEVNHGPLDG